MVAAGEPARAEREGGADDKADATAELILEVAQCFFRIRALGQRSGLITEWGGGSFGLLRSLALLGPLTVPQIAKMRPTSRQRMQRLADELAAAGLVQFAENPKHRRSRLVLLTSEGENRYLDMNRRLRELASDFGSDMDEGDIRISASVVKQLSGEIAARV
jgi:DNA-binding MarR family transcriptional regulator